MRRINTLLFLAVLSVAGVCQCAQAANIVWDGDTSSDWTDGNNWVGGVAPANNITTDVATFTSAVTPFQPQINVARSVAGIEFTAAITGWTLSGTGTLTLGSTGLNVLPGNQGTVTGTYGITLPSIVLGANNTWNLGTVQTVNVSSVISGAFSFSKSTAGGGSILNLTGLNTYTGVTNPQRGVLQFNSIKSVGGGTSAFGAPTTVANGTLNMGATANPTLLYTGTGDTTNRVINLGGTTNTGYALTNNGTGAIVLTSNLTSTSSGTAGSPRTLTLNGANTDDNTVGGVIPALTAAGALINVAKAGTGKWVLSAANLYSGTTAVSNGSLEFNSIANVGGGASTFGAPTTVANGTIAFGGASPADLRYTGSGHSTDRVVNLSSSTSGPVAIYANGSGALTFTSAFTATGAATKTLTLRGTNTGLNTIGGAIVDNSGVNTTSLTKDDTGKWILGGANTYTGATNVSAGTLLVNGSLAAGSAVSVNGGTLGGTGSIGGPVTVATGGTLSPGASIESLATGAVTFNAGSTFKYELNTTSITADLLDSSGGVSLATSGSGVTFSASDVASGFINGGTKFTVIAYNGSLTGTFAGLPDLGYIGIGTHVFRIRYNDTSAGVNTFAGDNLANNNGFVTLTAVPELGSFLTMGLVGCCALAAVRLGKRYDFKALGL